MKTASSQLIELLKTNNFIMADLYTFTLRDGTIYRFTSYDIDLTWDGNKYAKNGLLIKRNGVKITTGIQVDSLEVTIYSQDFQMLSTSFLKLVSNGGLDGATLELYRLFFTDPLTPIGSLWVFSGRVSESSVTRFEARIQINSDTELLNIQMPKNLYQPSCVHAVYDTGCTASKRYVSKSVALLGTKQLIYTTDITQTNGWFNEGIIEFTSGANTGIKRTVKTHANNTITLILPLPNTPAIGDTFTLLAGCNRTMTACASKFSNIANFRGYPYIPNPETIR